jgi:hypothetical protein
LLERVGLFLKDQNLLVFSHIHIDLIRNLVFAFIGPYSLQAFNLKAIAVLEDLWFAKSNHMIFFNKANKGKNHIYDGHLVIDIKQNVNVLLDVLYYAVK